MTIKNKLLFWLLIPAVMLAILSAALWLFTPNKTITPGGINNKLVRTDVQLREHESTSLEELRNLTDNFRSEVKMAGVFVSHVYLRNFLILMGLVCSISSVVVIKISKRITESLEIITEGTKRIASGDIESPLLLDGVEGDMKELGESFNSMMSKLREKEEKNRGLFLQVKRGRDEWQATFDSITDVITILDKNFRIVRANKTFFENFNIDKTRLKEKKCFEVFHGTDSPRENCPLIRCIDNLKTVSEEVADTRMDGIFLVTVFPLVDERGEFYGAVHQIKDITFQKRLHKELIKKANKLDEANKELERLSRIVSELT